MKVGCGGQLNMTFTGCTAYQQSCYTVSGKPSRGRKFSIAQSNLAKDSSVATTCDGYITCVNLRYPGMTRIVVFDGYANSADTTKSQERMRRYRLRRSAGPRYLRNKTIFYQNLPKM